SAMDPLKGYILVTTMLERYHEMVKGEKPDWAGSLGMASLVRKEGYVKPISMLTFGREQITDVLIKNTNSKVANVATAQVKDPAECKGRHSLRAVIDDPKIVEGLFKRAARNEATVNDLVFACARKILTDWNRERGAKVGRFRFMLITSLAGRMPETKGEGAGLSGLNFVHKDPDADLDAMMRDFRDQRRNQLERGVDVQFNYTLRKIVQATRVLPLSKRTKLVRRLIERIPCTFYLSNLGTVWPKSKGSMESTIVKVGDFEINDMHSSASISRNLGLGLTIRSHNNRMYLNYVCDRFRFSLEEAKDITDRLTAEIIAAADPVE
ncbi:hypothetical protein KDL45_01290, partial [bacterium]|nr:hypothetical protein [bacterium]